MTRCRTYFVGLVLLLLDNIVPRIQGQEAPSVGNPSCPCLKEHTPNTLQLHQRELDGKQCMVYVNRNNKHESCLDLDYGLNECKSWEDGTHGKVPECTGNDKPLWCSDWWCYVDGATCTSSDTFQVEQEGGLPSDWFEGANLMYSYATCGTASYFAKYAVANKMTAAELRQVPESHIASIIETFERESMRIAGGTDKEGNELATCEFLDSCECDTCGKVEGQWGAMEVDLRKVTVTWNQKERGHFEEETRCLGRQIQNAYRSVAQQTYNDPNRVAYMYFGLQENGALLQWPACDWCPPAYDARFRPWYATAVSGPKDVVLTLDNSGSMAGKKWNLLIEGVAKVMDTLTEYDYLGLILFSDISMIYEPDAFSDPSLKQGEFLRPATKILKEDMMAWLKDGARSPMGGTMFDIAFSDTFRFLQQSQMQGDSTTSGCQTAILFMTDGEDTSEFQTASLEEMQKGLDRPAIIFTYAFGDGADIDLPKEIACAHKGVYYEVPDDADIGGVMSKYYTYFAQGVENSVARWTTYDDAVTGEELMAACLPAYRKDAAKSGEETVLLGAGCMDINMLIRLSVLRDRAAWPAFVKDVRTRSSRCATFHLANAKLDLIREQSDSSCKPVDHTTTYWIVGGIAIGIVGAICLCFSFILLSRKIRARRIANKQRKALAQAAGGNNQYNNQRISNQQNVETAAPPPTTANAYPQQTTFSPVNDEQPIVQGRPLPSVPPMQTTIPVAQAVYDYPNRGSRFS